MLNLRHALTMLLAVLLGCAAIPSRMAAAADAAFSAAVGETKGPIWGMPMAVLEAPSTGTPARSAMVSR